MQPTTRLRPRRQGGKKVGLQHSMLVVPQFRPGVRKQDKGVRDSNIHRDRLQEEAGFGPNEVEIVQSGAIPLFQGTANAIAGKIHADTDRLPVRRRILREEVAMSAADFPQERGLVDQNSLQFSSQAGPTFVEDRGEFCA